MSLHPDTMLALGSLPRPSILAEPGLVIRQGHFVAFVCSNPSGYDIFCLEKKGHKVMDKENIGSSITEARFHLGPVNESTAGIYCCVYKKEPNWSLHSETLELKVTSEDVTKSPNPGSPETPVFTLQSYTVWNGTHMALAGVILFVLGVIIGEYWHKE
ncbi:leukocyte-associated immunoglobulin-like receptor 2 [Microtus pennsylvanicus]|uniref:leukocyte-associated immunoglobulin-like receptor 2 n=1 Tax=Microtus pennsylvanicus TaxID=10058 RepID=UPI003F6C99A2